MSPNSERLHHDGQLASLTDWRDLVTIVPFSGVQILDFGFALDKLELRPLRFIERVVATHAEGTEWKLIPLTGDEALDAKVFAQAHPEDREYAIAPVRALEPFLEKWMPLPILRLSNEIGEGGEALFDSGPTNWARIRTVELPRPDPKTGHTHRVQIALDTSLVASNPDSYVAPTYADAEKRREFRLVADPAQMDWFLRRREDDGEGGLIDPQDWVGDWLDDAFLSFKRAEKPGKRITRDMLERDFEHFARYLSYLRLIETAVRMPRLQMVNIVSARDRAVPVAVDLVVDIGNSRTCGIFIERFPGESQLDLARAYPLELRDISRPELVHRGLFPSRVEFAENDFGAEKFARRARRGKTFVWPAFTRIGPEALRLIASEEGTEIASGLSSPKRYLWDTQPRPQDWRFHHHDDPSNLPRSVRQAMSMLNVNGDVIPQIQEDMTNRLRSGRDPAALNPAARPGFSNSSLFGFMLAEIIAHALVQVNSPAGRARRSSSDLPRKLSRIILTLPTATTAQEQAIIRSRARGALKLVWSLMGLADSQCALQDPPALFVEWDEASCSQLVYLYSELTQKFDGRIQQFLELKGQPRPRLPGGRPEPSLRLASIDIGGGTTDLMVTTYWGEADRMLHPHQTFREGFRIAGDELLQRVISEVVLTQLRAAITEAGGLHIDRRMTELFGGDMGARDQQSLQQRRQFALRVLVPIGVAVLRACETAPEDANLSLAIGDVLQGPAGGEDILDVQDTQGRGSGAGEAGQKAPPEALLAYLERPAAELGARDFRLMDTVIHWNRAEVDALTRQVFQQMMSNLAEVIDHLGVDIVLLTGRPSRQPAVRAILEEMMVVPPHRLVSMHRYRTGSWYPFRDPVTHRIGDPKSTVAMGGLLISLCDSWVPNFKVATAAFQMRSTARYIGEMERRGQILDEKLLFRDLDLDDGASGRGRDQQATLKMFTPIYIGARQLPLERWTATPLFRLDFANSSIKSATALKVTLERTAPDDDEDGSAPRPETVLRREIQREAFTVAEVEDEDPVAGRTCRPSDVVLRLHTLGFEDAYWIDTGKIEV